MKIICNKSELQNGVNIVLKAVPVRTTLPILQCIFIDTTDGIIKMTANDMELGIETIVDGDVIDKGKVALDAKLFSEIVRKLPDSEVVIECDENSKTLIRCEKARFNIAGRSGDDFVMLPEIGREKCIHISQFSLKEVIRQTIFSTSDSESNHLMSGVLFEIDEDHLRVVALDGQRIAIRRINLKESYGKEKIIVPGKTLGEISKILDGDMEKDVAIYFESQHVLFAFDQTIVLSRLIEGEYFQIDRMISNDYNTKITINKKELQNCIERAALLIRESERKPLIVNITDGSLTMTIQSAIGSMNEDIDIEKEGSDLMIPDLFWMFFV